MRLNEVRLKIEEAVEELILPKEISEAAHNLFRDLHYQHKKGGSHPRADKLAAAVLYFESRRHKSPLTLREVCNIFNISMIERGPVMKAIELVKQKTKIDLPPLRPEDFLPRFCRNLGIDEDGKKLIKIKKKAKEISNLGVRRPSLIAAMAICLVCKEQFTIEQITARTDVSHHRHLVGEVKKIFEWEEI